MQIGADDEYLTIGVSRGRIGVALNVERIPIEKLRGFQASCFVDHAALRVDSGLGLRGGGSLVESVTLHVDVTTLPEVIEVPPSTPLLVGENRMSFERVNQQLDHEKLANRAEAQHVDHTKIEIQPGVGLSGGGDLTTTRALRLALQTLEALRIDDLDEPELWVPVVDKEGLHGRISLRELVRFVAAQGQLKEPSNALPA